MKKKLVIFGHYGVPNWGDEAILSGLLKKLHPEKWDVTVLSPFPEFVQKEHRVKCLPPPPAGIRSFLKNLFSQKSRKTTKALREADFILFGGGGLFQEEPKKALRIWNRYLRLCISLKKKVLLVGNSIGPFFSRRSLQKTAKLFRSVSFFSVRDKKSYELLLQMGVPERKLSLATDFAFVLPIKKTRAKEKNSILLSFRREDISDKDIREIEKLCETFRKKRTQVLVLPMQEYQSGDEMLAEKLQVKLLFPKNLSEVRKYFSEASLVIANRLHAGIFSILSGTPILMISSRKKIPDFFESAELSELVLKKSIAFLELKKRAEFLVKNKKSVQGKIAMAAQKEKQKTDLLLPEFF